MLNNQIIIEVNFTVLNSLSVKRVVDLTKVT